MFQMKMMSCRHHNPLLCIQLDNLIACNRCWSTDTKNLFKKPPDIKYLYFMKWYILLKCTGIDNVMPSKCWWATTIIPDHPCWLELMQRCYTSSLCQELEPCATQRTAASHLDCLMSFVYSGVVASSQVTPYSWGFQHLAADWACTFKHQRFPRLGGSSASDCVKGPFRSCRWGWASLTPESSFSVVHCPLT